MAKRNESVEPGLSYLQELGLKYASTKETVIRKLSAVIGRDQAYRILKEIDRRAEKGADSLTDRSFYEMKNRDYAASINLTGLIDGDIIRKACNWIAGNKSLFGKEVLDIGCDCGIVSCFLARALPDSQITAIDRCKEAISVAGQLADRLKLNNITFVASAAEEMPSRKFNTVFSMRTLGENSGNNRDDYPVFENFVTQADYMSAKISKYSSAVASLIKDDGTLVSIERCQIDPLLLAWIDALNKDGLRFLSHDRLSCAEQKVQSYFAVVTAIKETSAQQQDILSFFSDVVEDEADVNVPIYEGEKADWYLLRNKGQFIKGVTAYNTEGKKLGRYGLWMSSRDETALLIYQADLEKRSLGVYDISLKEELLEALENMVKNTDLSKDVRFVGFFDR
ncbi:MAG: methyltransferase domain-containing protein [Clostridiales bacterium]|nr:methyltransferase domain-containing protein [Clostridiales bacterium]